MSSVETGSKIKRMQRQKQKVRGAEGIRPDEQI